MESSFIIKVKKISSKEKFKGLPKEITSLNCYEWEKELDDNDLKYLAENFQSLKEINITCCSEITSTGIFNLIPLSQTLEHLNIEDCPKLNIIECLDSLSNFSKLKSLSFSVLEFSDEQTQNEIIEKFKDILKNCQSLKEIYCSNQELINKLSSELSKNPDIIINTESVPCAGATLKISGKRIINISSVQRRRSNSATPPSPTEEQKGPLQKIRKLQPRLSGSFHVTGPSSPINESPSPTSSHLTLVPPQRA